MAPRSSASHSPLHATAAACASSAKSTVMALSKGALHGREDCSEGKHRSAKPMTRRSPAVSTKRGDATERIGASAPSAAPSANLAQSCRTDESARLFHASLSGGRSVRKLTSALRKGREAAGNRCSLCRMARVAMPRRCCRPPSAAATSIGARVLTEARNVRARAFSPPPRDWTLAAGKRSRGSSSTARLTQWLSEPSSSTSSRNLPSRSHPLACKASKPLSAIASQKHARIDAFSAGQPWRRIASAR
mmetsp:Transcript_46745/g.148303  ORF Transcript_46745/g.148303 Transcript_46745/m.148303 type:complete len:248 (-) Transcript_46745:286-1029(-)